MKTNTEAFGSPDERFWSPEPVTAAFLLGGFPQLALSAEAADTETAITPISVELQVNGLLHRLTLDPRTTLLDAFA
jgi:hypothetical protein